jgi:hypothetical protein
MLHLRVAATIEQISYSNVLPAMLIGANRHLAHYQVAIGTAWDEEEMQGVSQFTTGSGRGKGKI